MLIKPEVQKFAHIKVVGVGGGGTNALCSMMEVQQIQGVDFIAVNTDAQHLSLHPAPIKIQIGKQLTGGLGSGGDQVVGRKAAEENAEELHEHLSGADMVFITAGMGGGTGTGASPIVADIAKKQGALTVGVVTKPFDFEGAKRRLKAEEGIANLKEKVDTLIVIPNQRLLEIIEKTMPLLQAFRMADSVLGQSVQGISDIIVMPGLINRDFADVRSIMHEAGSALMGIGEASGENRAVAAAKNAIESPLLEASIAGAKGVLFNITGGKDLTLFEVDEAARVISEQADPDCAIIFGANIDEELKDRVKLTVIATGFDVHEQMMRNAKKMQEQKLQEEIPGESPDSEFELPAFMRRR